MTRTEGRPAKILALIPARGGSKSIPRKNLLMIAGKPLDRATRSNTPSDRAT